MLECKQIGTVDEPSSNPRLVSLLTDKDIQDLRISPSDLNLDTRNHEYALGHILEHIPPLHAGSRSLDLSGKHEEVVELVVGAFRRAGWIVDQCESEVKGQRIYNLITT